MFETSIPFTKKQVALSLTIIILISLLIFSLSLTKSELTAGATNDNNSSNSTEANDTELCEINETGQTCPFSDNIVINETEINDTGVNETIDINDTLINDTDLLEIGYDSDFNESPEIMDCSEGARSFACLIPPRD